MILILSPLSRQCLALVDAMCVDDERVNVVLVQLPLCVRSAVVRQSTGESGGLATAAFGPTFWHGERNPAHRANQHLVPYSSGLTGGLQIARKVAGSIVAKSFT